MSDYNNLIAQIESIDAKIVSLQRTFEKDEKKLSTVAKDLASDTSARQKVLRERIILNRDKVRQLYKKRGTLVTDVKNLNALQSQISVLSDDTPIMLMPVKLQTRFMTVKHFAKLEKADLLADEGAMTNSLKTKVKNYLTGALEHNSKQVLLPTLKAAKNKLTAFPKLLYDRVPDTKELWVRIIPDDIFFQTHEEELSNAEYQSGRLFWTETLRVKLDNPNKPQLAENQRLGLWKGLTGRYGIPRSQYILLETRPENWDAVNNVEALKFPEKTTKPDEDSSWSKAPCVKALPDQFIIRTFNGGLKKDHIGAMIPETVFVGFDPGMDMEVSDGDDSGELFEKDGRHGLRLPENIRWMVDFEEAVKIGLGIRIPLTEEEADKGFEKIIALGIKKETDKAKNGAVINKLFENHQYKPGGLSLIPNGTPTNNTDKNRAGGSTDDLSSKESLTLAAKQSAEGENDGTILSQALGLNKDSFSNIPNGDKQDIEEARLMNKVLWPATFGYSLPQLFPKECAAGTSDLGTLPDVYLEVDLPNIPINPGTIPTVDIPTTPTINVPINPNWSIPTNPTQNITSPDSNPINTPNPGNINPGMLMRTGDVGTAMNIDLTDILTPGISESNPFDSDLWFDNLKQFVQQYVLGRGILSSVRVDDQPYGFLPVTAYSRYRSQVPFFNNLVKKVLKPLDRYWEALLPYTARLNKENGGEDNLKELLRILRQHAGSIEFDRTEIKDESSVELWRDLMYRNLQTPEQLRDILYQLFDKQFEKDTFSYAINYNIQVQPPVFTHVPKSTRLEGPVVDKYPLSESRVVNNTLESIGIFTPDYLMTGISHERNYLKFLKNDYMSFIVYNTFLGSDLDIHDKNIPLLFLVCLFAFKSEYFKTAVKLKFKHPVLRNAYLHDVATHFMAHYDSKGENEDINVHTRNFITSLLRHLRIIAIEKKAKADFPNDSQKAERLQKINTELKKLGDYVNKQLISIDAQLDGISANIALNKWKLLDLPLNEDTPLPDSMPKKFLKEVRWFIEGCFIQEWYEDSEIKNLKNFRDLIGQLSDLPTARLERLFTESLDIAGYRLDAWWQALAAARIMGSQKHDAGLYYGAYAYLTNVQPDKNNEAIGIRMVAEPSMIPHDDAPSAFESNKTILSPVFLQNGMSAANKNALLKNAYVYLGEDFIRHNASTTLDRLQINSEDGTPKIAPIPKVDTDNQGFIPTPSLSHATTAAILKSAHANHNKGGENKDSNNKYHPFAVNLDSKRVRDALYLLEGMRHGQSLGALLGYRFERALHETAELSLNKYIYDFREKFPIGPPEETPANGEADEAIPAFNVVDGVALVERYRKNTWHSLVQSNHRGYIKVALQQLDDTLDGLHDLLMAESVFQTARGNMDRAALALRIMSGDHEGNFDLPEIIKIQRSGHTINHKVIMASTQLKNSWMNKELYGLSNYSTARTSGSSVFMNNFLGEHLPRPEKIAFRVRHWLEPEEGESINYQYRKVLLSDFLSLLQPIDFLYMLYEHKQKSSLSQLLWKIAYHLSFREKIDFDYVEILEQDRTGFKKDEIHLAALRPLVNALGDIYHQSRPLKPNDILLPNDPKKDTFDYRIQFPHLWNISYRLIYKGSAYVCLSSFRNFLIKQVEKVENWLNTGREIARVQWISTSWGLRGCFYHAGNWGLYNYIPECKWNTDRTTLSEQVAQGKKIVKILDKKIDLAEKAFFNGLFKFANQYLLRCIFVWIEWKSQHSDDSQQQILAELKGLIPSKSIEESRDDAYERVTSNLITVIFRGFLFRKYHPNSFKMLSEVLAPLYSGLQTLEKDELNNKGVKILWGLDIHGASSLRQLQKEALPLTKNYLSTDQTEAELLNIMKIVLGDSSKIWPNFVGFPHYYHEVDKHFKKEADIQQSDMDFPIENWLQTLAPVRPKIAMYQKFSMLKEALSLDNFPMERKVLQLPFEEGQPWVGIPYPEGTELTENTLSIVGEYPEGFLHGRPMVGMVIDEWTEVIPNKEIDAGVTMHYDQPNSEAPQTVLLATTPQLTGAWDWEDLVAAVDETFDMAKKRTVGPELIKASPLGQLLPLTLGPIRSGYSPELPYSHNQSAYDPEKDEGSTSDAPTINTGVD